VVKGREGERSVCVRVCECVYESLSVNEVSVKGVSEALVQFNTMRK
jgi:hypothetical protein